MGSRARTVWMVGAVLVGGVALAAARSGAPGQVVDAAAARLGAALAVPAPTTSTAGVVWPRPARLDPGLAAALHRAGLHPEALTAAGVSADAADDVVASVKSWLAEHQGVIGATDEALLAATKARDDLFRKVRSGRGSHEEIAACPVAKANYDAALAARDALLTSVFEEGTDGLLQEQITVLSRLRTNAPMWKLPVQYMVVDRTQQDWVRLRHALASERQPYDEDDPPDPEQQSYLASVRADIAVATALVNLDTRLGGVRSAWEAAAALTEEQEE